MSSVVLNRVEENLSKCCLCNALTYIAIIPCWRFEIKPSVDNGQQTTDNRLRVWRLSLKKLYSEFNSQKSYLTKFYKVCRHALRWRVVITLRHTMFRSLNLSKCRTYAFDKLRYNLPIARSSKPTAKEI